MQQRYLELLRRLAKASEGWPSCAQIDESPKGKIPRVNLSVKLSALCARFDPLDPNTETTVRERLRELFREAGRLGAAITVDMEQYAFKDLTLEIFRGVLEEDEFRERPHAAIALQAYLRDAEQDVRELIRWARRHKRRLGVRLVKGAYWDSEVAWAKQKSWPIPVYLDKAETDASYERLSRLLLENHDMIDAAFGSHNLAQFGARHSDRERSSACRVNGYEIQMLYGMAEPVRQAISAKRPAGARLFAGGRIVAGHVLSHPPPDGEYFQYFFLAPDLCRSEETSTSFDQAAGAGAETQRGRCAANNPRSSRGIRRFSQRAADRFFRAGKSPTLRSSDRKASRRIHAPKPQARQRQMAGIGESRRSNGNRRNRCAYPASIRRERSDRHGRRGFFPEWRAHAGGRSRRRFSSMPPRVMREKRCELAAWEVFEVGKGWREADADVTEAIDYLDYYAHEMLRLRCAARRRKNLPAKPTCTSTSRAASPPSSRRGTFRWRFSPA